MIADIDRAYPHVSVDSSGIVTIAGTTTKVVEVALDRIAHHWDADEIQRQHPHLSMSQIHAALTYYYDRQTHFDELITLQLNRVASLRQETENPVLQQKLLMARQAATMQVVADFTAQSAIRLEVPGRG